MPEIFIYFANKSCPKQVMFCNISNTPLGKSIILMNTYKHNCLYNIPVFMNTSTMFTNPGYQTIKICIYNSSIVAVHVATCTSTASLAAAAVGK